VEVLSDQQIGWCCIDPLNWQRLPDKWIIQFKLWRKSPCSALKAPTAFRWSAITTGTFDVELATKDHSKLRLPFSLLQANIPAAPRGQESFRCNGIRKMVHLPFQVRLRELPFKRPLWNSGQPQIKALSIRRWHTFECGRSFLFRFSDFQLAPVNLVFAKL
jgi:hypothetical protein